MDSTPKNIWAVLIGIDGYDCSKVTNLNGCVQDVLDMKMWLCDSLKVQSKHMKVLTSSNPEANPQVKSLGELPTRENIIGALEWVIKNAGEYDSVFVHYSGHGGRCYTQYPQLKGEIGSDEALVPMDYPKGKPLRDVEFGELLDKMVKAKLVVFAVLDCCHSGGATRGLDDGDGLDNGRIRSCDLEDSHTPSSTIDAISSAKSPSRGAGLVTESWWRLAQEYTVLAACQPNELAQEMRNSGKHNGKLTYCLLNLLNSLGQHSVSITYRMLYHQLQTNFPQQEWQNPMLSGNGNRLLFGYDKLQSTYNGIVKEVLSGCSLKLDIGEAHGVHIGDEYAIYPRFVSTTVLPGEALKEERSSMNKLCIESVEGLTSIGHYSPQATNIDVGCGLKLLTRAYDSRYIRFSSSQSLEIHQSAFETLKDNWKSYEDGSIPIFLDENGKEGILAHEPTFEIDVDTSGHYIIKDSKSHKLPNIPPLPIGGAVEARRVIDVIRHLVQYRLVSTLQNPASRMSKYFSFGVTSTIQGRETCIVDAGDSVTLYFKNELPKPPPPLPGRPPKNTNSLYLSVFNLTPFYGIHSILRDEVIDYQVVEPKTEIFPTIEMSIPDLASEDVITDIIKVFVSTTPTHFELLALDDLDPKLNAIWRGGPTRSHGDVIDLQEILDGLGVGKGGRDVLRKESILGEWETAQSVVLTRRK
jgi:hypothetical protein